MAEVWVNPPTRVQAMGPGVKKPGGVVQTVILQNATGAAVSNTTPIPTALSQVITPTSAANLVRMSGWITTQTDNGGGRFGSVQMYRNGVAIGQGQVMSSTATLQSTAAIAWLDRPSVSTAVTYAAYIASGGAYPFAASNGHLLLDEIMG